MKMTIDGSLIPTPFKIHLEHIVQEITREAKYFRNMFKLEEKRFLWFFRTSKRVAIPEKITAIRESKYFYLYSFEDLKLSEEYAETTFIISLYQAILSGASVTLSEQELLMYNELMQSYIGTRG